MKKILTGNKGFSLIELIVVIAILGVLVGVAAPNLIGYVEKTRKATDINTVENVRRAAEAYYAESEGDTDITAEDLVELYPEGLPALKSKAFEGTDITISVDENGKVTVNPTPDEIEAGGV